MSDKNSYSRTTELLTQIDADCQRISACIDSDQLINSSKVKELSLQLAVEKKKVVELEGRLEEAESKSKSLKNVNNELAEVQAARSRDLEELAAIMTKFKPLLEEGNRA